MKSVGTNSMGARDLGVDKKFTRKKVSEYHFLWKKKY